MFDEGIDWLLGFVFVLVCVMCVVVRFCLDGLFEFFDCGEVFGYVEYVDLVFVVYVGDCL